MRTLLLPPIWFLLCFITILALPGPALLPEVPRLVSATLVTAAGIALLVSAQRAYAANDSEINTFKTPRGLVTSGPFRFTRNPMYLGFLLALAGAGIGRATPIAVLPWCVFAALCVFVYVPFEERAAAEAFGEAYQAYRARTARWLGWTRQPGAP